ncbi:MAG: pyridoxal phosphate-dependent aminotransferase [Candidatus Burarchaeum sp.]|nr:pyridoxal phosphate-dependent aminotransferase [Candidatus Burarchaeum sp.]MDO8339426.1 pyridoxal phosphate-dependent aminotransferase [Candidatus Burarchaeum sp.]
MQPIAKRVSKLGTENAFNVGARVSELERQGKKIYKFHIGQPDFHTPENIKKAAVDAINANVTGYTEPAGTFELRQACAEYISKTRGVAVSPEEVVVTPGAKPIIFAAGFICVERGDEVVYPNPSFPIYESVIEANGGKAVPLRLDEETGFCFDHEELKAKVHKGKTKMIMINSPANPTGGVLSEADLKLVRDLAVDNDTLVFSDEIYDQIIYEGEHRSLLAMDGMKERTILLNGHSKTYSMTGWRLGYGIMPKDIAEKFTRLGINIYSCPNAFVQKAGVEALRGPQDSVARMREEFRKRRDFIVKGLNEIKGVKCQMPKGAFYAFPNVKGALRRLGMKKSIELQEKLLYEKEVSMLSGTYFGKYGEGYMRVSYATGIADIEEGLRRMRELIEGK